MKLDDDYDELSRGKYFTTAVASGVVIMIAILLLVLIANADKLKKNSSASHSVSSEVTVSFSESAYSDVFHTSSSLTPADLDFFEMYPKDGETSTTDSTSFSVSTTDSSYAQPIDELPADDDPATDGNHTLLTYADGTEEWVEISEYIKRNNYDYTRLINEDGIMEYLDENGKIVSYFGVDVSKDQDYINYIKLQKAGVDFVMIRVGARGYSSGDLTIDDYYKDNIKRATDAGLDVGVYFLSQAITEEEAEEEAQLVIDSMRGYKLTYPVGYVMTYREDANSRVETLTRNEKTMIARAFLKKIEEAGYKTVLYGSKVWLIKYLELSKIVSDFDVWYASEEDLPTYPYRFTMWQYNNSGTIDGIKGTVSFNVSFVDYSLK
ncbi:MAG: hypothetical protein K6A74_06905 [Lachnospiraceae bacterium]|nr:hypothetical protein [Lachnospiraceae bacterium]